ncbi:mammalian cell entry protein [Mycolicibacterium mucogenicum]|uniref:Mammalian cell entry protein n=1 Tax=Mycolicibacterium mucogenicum TaxID=56689 RepID=A0A1A3HCW2_MYCMU|nr:virulence factor Mce family protein [Mycolicibacterium mucogenicum]OBJ45446.1 mammalian cell entry protein [Mycolicibacterium mucogenicum]
MKKWLPNGRAVLVIALVAVVVAGALAAVKIKSSIDKTVVIGYFDNSTGLFVGDDVRIRGVQVGHVEKIEPEPLRTKITLSFDRKYKVPANANAIVLSPQLVTGRAIQLTPPYTDGPVMTGGAVIPQSRTAVPVEWDEVRAQLQRLTEMLQPTKPGGVSTLGAVINSAADNLRGQGATIHDTVIKLSQTLSALGDHSKDIFGTVRSLSLLVSALHDSSDLLTDLNTNLAAVSSVLADDPNKVGQAVDDLNSVVGDVRSFIAENREPIGVAADKLTSISKAVMESMDDIKQTLHILPTGAADFNNIYEPANGSLTGELMINNFANPLSFLCGAIQAASRLQSEQAAKLCVQYLAPIVKNRQYNFLPLGENLFVGAQARPNEVTYSENRLRPDYVPPAQGTPQGAPSPAAAPDTPAPGVGAPLPAEVPSVASSTPAVPTPPTQTDAAAGLAGMMTPPGGGS